MVPLPNSMDISDLYIGREVYWCYGTWKIDYLAPTFAVLSGGPLGQVVIARDKDINSFRPIEDMEWV